jgi:hypothetical protein
MLARAVSLVSFAWALFVVVWAGARERRTGVALWAGMAAAGVVIVSFRFTGAFYDLVRGDSLLLAIEAAALLLALRGRGWKSAALAGLLIALGFFTKQTASILGIGLGLGLLAAAWRRGIVYGLCAAVTLGAGLLLLNNGSQGWFWKYIFELHQSHAFSWPRTLNEAPRAILNHAWPLMLAFPLSALGCALAGRLRREDFIVVAVALAGLVAACVGFGTQWAFSNAYVPAIYFPALATAVFTARLLAHARATARLGSVAVAALAILALGFQNARAGRPDARALAPRAADRAAAARFLDTIRKLPGDGFIPFHPWYAVLAGKRPFVHRMGVMDVAASYGRPDGLDQALADQKFAFIVLDWKSQPGEWPFLDSRYRLVHQFREGFDSVRMFAGAETSPSQLLVPVRAAPALPAGAVRLADFESGAWGSWTVEGDAFGRFPAAAADAMFGRFAADSTSTPSATGVLRSPPLFVTQPRLRFTLHGPNDPNLRVVLLDGPETPLVVTPNGQAQTVEWDLSAFVGRTLTIAVEDRSTTAGLSVDEFVTF